MVRVGEKEGEGDRRERERKEMGIEGRGRK